MLHLIRRPGNSPNIREGPNDQFHIDQKSIGSQRNDFE
jgi:hypothetical protein